MLQPIDRDGVLSELLSFQMSVANQSPYAQWKRYVKRLRAMLPSDPDLIDGDNMQGVESLYRLLDDVKDTEGQPRAAEVLARDDGTAAELLKLRPWLKRLIRDFSPPRGQMPKWFQDTPAVDDEKTPATRQRGRKKPGPQTVAGEDEVYDGWQQARDAGVDKGRFARDKKMSVKDFDRLLDRVAARRKRSRNSPSEN